MKSEERRKKTWPASPYNIGAFMELKAFTNVMPSLEYEECLIQSMTYQMWLLWQLRFLKIPRKCCSVSSLLAELTEKENPRAGNSVSETIRHV